MYINAPDQIKVFEEAYRVMESKGRFLIWDVVLPQRKDEEKDIVEFYLKAILPDREIKTGYGTKLQEQKKDLPHQKKMAENAGFIVSKQSKIECVFFLELKKP